MHGEFRILSAELAFATPWLGDLLRSRVQTGDDDDASASEWSQQLKTASGDAKLDINVTLANINSSIFGFHRLF